LIGKVRPGHRPSCRRKEPGRKKKEKKKKYTDEAEAGGVRKMPCGMDPPMGSSKKVIVRQGAYTLTFGGACMNRGTTGRG